MPRNISLRDIAQRLGLSHTTVSEALRGHPRVNLETQKRVKKVAEELGYRRNVLAGALMAEMRRCRVDAFHGTLAVVDFDGPFERRPGAVRYHRDLVLGATKRAAELDFGADMIVAETEKFSFARLENILRTRGIRGMLLLPMRHDPELTNFDWSGFSAVYTDYVIEHPRLHAVCPDHYRGMLTVLEKLRSMGYRRPGLVLQGAHDARVLRRWEAAYHVYQIYHDSIERVPPLVRDYLEHVERRDFEDWLRTTRCDVVISHSPDVKTWMEAAGARVPETHGFCCLNVINSSFPCAGLDLMPQVLGQRAMEQLIGLVMHNECGVPNRPMTNTVQPEWVDGPTVREMP